MKTKFRRAQRNANRIAMDKTKLLIKKNVHVEIGKCREETAQIHFFFLNQTTLSSFHVLIVYSLYLKIHTHATIAPYVVGWL